jgi:(1->4)-alpha-D-glucan 1-alpha-D-glucosylmutase
MIKAAKEAKVHTSWINPNEAYDEALRAFATRILAPVPGNRFLADFAAFHAPVARLGMVNGLAQTLLKITAPGVPDFYQGTELWDLNLVDPDNRCPVDFATRARLLDDLRQRSAAGDLRSLARELVQHWPDGRIKLYTIQRALGCRRAAGDLFRRGEYVPLSAGGAAAGHLCAFARRRGPRVALTVVPRLTAGLTDRGARLPLGRAVWGDTRVALPADLARATWTNVFTGTAVEPTSTGAGVGLLAGDLLDEFPVALLETSRDGGLAGPPAPNSGAA